MTQQTKAITRDPMLDAIERHRIAWRRFGVALDKWSEVECDVQNAARKAVENEKNAADAAEVSSRRALAATVPRNAVSLVAMLDHIETFRWDETVRRDGINEFFADEACPKIFFRTIKKYARGAVGFPLGNPKSKPTAKRAV